MATKQYWVWWVPTTDPLGGRWTRIYSGAARTKGKASHEIVEIDGKFYTHTYGPLPKNRPPVADVKPKSRVLFSSIQGAWIDGDKHADKIADVPDDVVVEYTAKNGLTYHLIRTACGAFDLPHWTARHVDRRIDARSIAPTVPQEDTVTTTKTKLQARYYGEAAPWRDVTADHVVGIWRDAEPEIAALLGVLGGRTVHITDGVGDGWEYRQVDVTPTPEERRLASHREMMSLFSRVGFGSREARHALSSAVLGRKVTTNAIKSLTDAERDLIIQRLKELETPARDTEAERRELNDLIYTPNFNALVTEATGREWGYDGGKIVNGKPIIVHGLYERCIAQLTDDEVTAALKHVRAAKGKARR